MRLDDLLVRGRCLITTVFDTFLCLKFFAFYARFGFSNHWALAIQSIKIVTVLKILTFQAILNQWSLQQRYNLVLLFLTVSSR